MKHIYYHASPHRFKPGDFISPHFSKDWSESFSPSNCVFLTAHPEPHFTILERAIKEKWYVYLVSPIDDKVYPGTWDDYLCFKGARVIKCVGNAAGLARVKPNRKSKEARYSKIHTKRYPDGYYGFPQIVEPNRMSSDKKKQLSEKYQEKYNMSWEFEALRIVKSLPIELSQLPLDKSRVL